MTAAKVQPDLLEQLGLDDTIACEYLPNGDGQPSCGVTASTWLICRFCQHHIALCNVHVQHLDTRPHQHVTRRWLVLRTLWIHAARCSDCGRYVPDAQWRLLWMTVPIGRP